MIRNAEVGTWWLSKEVSAVWDAVWSASGDVVGSLAWPTIQRLSRDQIDAVSTKIAEFKTQFEKSAEGQEFKRSMKSMKNFYEHPVRWEQRQALYPIDKIISHTQLWDEKRISETENLLGRPLTEDQKIALIKAHKYCDSKWWIFSMQDGEKVVWRRTLSKAGFSTEEIEKTGESWLGGWAERFFSNWGWLIINAMFYWLYATNSTSDVWQDVTLITYRLSRTIHAYSTFDEVSSSDTSVSKWLINKMTIGSFLSLWFTVLVATDWEYLPWLEWLKQVIWPQLAAMGLVDLYAIMKVQWWSIDSADKLGWNNWWN